MDLCSADDCLEPAQRAGLCWAHLRQHYEGRNRKARRYTSGWDRIVEAAIAFADAPADDDMAYRKAATRLRKAVEHFAAARKTRKRSVSDPEERPAA